jgi:hypothetical protein
MDRRWFITSALPSAAIFVLTASAAKALTTVAPAREAAPANKNANNDIEHVWWRRRWGWRRGWGWRRWRRW